MVASAHDNYSVSIGNFNSNQQRKCHSTLYLYIILKSHETNMNLFFLIKINLCENERSEWLQTLSNFYIFQIKLLLAVAFFIGITGIFIKPLAHIISWLWLKLGDLLGFVVSKIVLSLIYFFFLLPIAILLLPSYAAAIAYCPIAVLYCPV